MTFTTSITHNSHGDKYTLYSLRHFYAVLSLRRGIGVFDVARNMETSVQVIQSYYGKHATSIKPTIAAIPPKTGA
jgi:integrase